MKKSELEESLSNWLTALNEELAVKHVPSFSAPEKLRHWEIDGENSWAWRLSEISWPHLPDEQASLPSPGLRAEIWFYAKRPERKLLLLCGKEGLITLQKELRPVFQTLRKGGKYAGRYRELDHEVTERYPGCIGIQRLAVLDQAKFLKAVSQLLIDTVPLVTPVCQKWLATPENLALYQQAAARDPFLELRNKWPGKG